MILVLLGSLETNANFAVQDIKELIVTNAS